MHFFLRRKQVGIWYNSWFTFSGKVSKKKPYRISWAFSPPLCLPETITPSVPPKKRTPPTSLRYLGASIADDKCFFPSSLHGCSVWWPETQLVAENRPDPRPKDSDVKFRAQQKVCFFGGFKEHKTSNHFWRIPSGKWRWFDFRGGMKKWCPSRMQSLNFRVQGTFFCGYNSTNQKESKRNIGRRCLKVSNKPRDLVGGWTNPFEKDSSKWVHLPQIRVNIKNIWVATTQKHIIDNKDHKIHISGIPLILNHHLWDALVVWCCIPTHSGCQKLFCQLARRTRVALDLVRFFNAASKEI